ncbi:diguanylate cyclase [Sulfurimonas sp. HSL-1716]|uniref:diguanylate cyclase domain-containing protein n=1 Tax=Hydrocurvibacter sulfurireducens TaxID=3131937 RepID=UPI0031F99662
MIQSANKVNKKVSLIFIIFAIALIFSFISLENLFLGNQANKISLENAVKKTKERELFFKNFLDHASNTLHTVRKSRAFNEFLTQQNGEAIEDMKDMFKIIAKDDLSLMQLRYIDKEGYERIRIDREKENSEPFFIHQADLQNKSNRYYFFDSKNKPLEKVWFSALDLNIEHKKVEIPYKPTLRAVLPIEKNGHFDGILIINYFMKGFLQRFLNAPLYDMILINDQGYPLSHYDNSKSWGFYRHPKYNIKSDFANSADKILSGSITIHENFISKRLDLPIKDGLILIMQLKHKYQQDTSEQRSTLYLFIVLIVFFLAAITSVFLSSSVGKLYNELNKKLEKSQLKFFTLFKESLDAIVLIDPATQKFIEFNQKTLDMYGYTKEEFKNITVRDLEVNDTDDEIKKRQERIFEKGWNTFVTKHRTKNGLEKDVNVNAVTIMLDGMTYLYGTFHDITKEKKYERSLKKLLNQQEALMQIKTTGFVHLKNRRFLWTNEIFDEMFGYAKGELQGKDARIIYADEQTYLEYGKEAYETLAEAGVYTGEIECVKKDSTPIVLRVSLTALKHSDSEALGVFIDITKEKEQQKLINSQKDELEAIFSVSKDGIAILDLQTNFLDCNKAYLEMTGFTKEELLSKSCLELTAPEDYEHALEAVEIVKKEGYLKSFNKTCIVKNGKKLFVNMSISMMPDNKRLLVTTKDITEMKKYEKELEFIAHYDSLTGLPNRILKSDRLNQAMLHVQRNGGYLAVVYLDLDGFKEINDTYGHEIGDKVLIEVSKRMKFALRNEDTLSRLGGDEFVAIIADMNDRSVASPVLERLLNAANEPILIGKLDLQVSASIGVTFYPQDSELDGDQLIRQADQAMYVAKQAGKNRYYIFNS